MKVIYIASPYTKGDVAANIKRSMIVADKLIALGYCPIVPLMSHFLHMYNPRPYEDWLRIEEELVRRSEVVLRIYGASTGADREVKLAKELGIHVVYTIDEVGKGVDE